jgi:hypothetical protein
MNLKALFPKASKSFFEANPQPDAQPEAKSYATAILTPWRVTRDKMNKTESEFSLRLEAMKRKDEIKRWEFEGITLRWGDGMRYTPDFVVFTNVMQMLRQMELLKPDQFPTVEWKGIKLIEVKGAHIWDRDTVRFKGAAAYWPEFAFEMWQKKAGEWKRIR